MIYGENVQALQKQVIDLQVELKVFQALQSFDHDTLSNAIQEDITLVFEWIEDITECITTSAMPYGATEGCLVKNRIGK